VVVVVVDDIDGDGGTCTPPSRVRMRGRNGVQAGRVPVRRGARVQAGTWVAVLTGHMGGGFWGGSLERTVSERGKARAVYVAEVKLGEGNQPPTVELLAKPDGLIGQRRR